MLAFHLNPSSFLPTTMLRFQLPAAVFLTAYFLCLMGSPVAVQAQRDLKDIPDPDPEAERRTFEVAEGLEVNLFAADPLLAKPIQMNFDPQGRLWVASSEIYPHIAPGQPATDKILVLEDRDADGMAETTRVFADGLLIPTGVAPGEGGAYVANSTELIHLRDLDGDGQADERQVLLSGFGTEDTHHIIHTFRWGVDGGLYFNQSIYIHSHVETPWGVRRLGGGGIWQFRPDTLELEVFSRGLVNPWGHQQDAFGQSFATDGAGGEGINFVFPGSVFLTAPGATRIVKGLNPGSPKHCGLEVISGPHFPEEWRGSLVTNDFRGHRVCRFVLSEDGSGFSSREQGEIIKTNHVAFRPIDVKMGPDGALYIADWYNPIIQHGEVDFRDPRRDHTHGRIWRVTAKGRPLMPRRDLSQLGTADLLDVQNSAALFERVHARQVLKERGQTAVLPLLPTWVDSLEQGSQGSDHARLEALWTYQALDVVQPQLLGSVLKSVDPKVRAAGVRVVSAWRSKLDNPLELLDRAIQDESPRVRLEAVRALALVPSRAAAEIVIRAVERPLDGNLDFALWQAMRDLEAHWLPPLEAGEPVFRGDVRSLTFALGAVGAPGVTAPLLKLLSQDSLSAAERQQVLRLIAALGGPEELRLVLDRVLPLVSEPGRWPEIQTVLTILADTTSRRRILPSGDLAKLDNLLGHDPELDVWTCHLAGLWRVEALRPKLAELAGSTSRGAPAAISALAALGGDDSRNLLKSLAGAGQAFATRRAAAQGMLSLDPVAGTKLAIEVLSAAQSSDDSQALWTSLWQNKSAPESLPAALANVRLPADVAKLGIRSARISGRELSGPIAAISAAGGLNAPLAEIPRDELDRLVKLVRETGNPQRGEAVFRRTETLCLRCHAISGAGGQVGPDLTSLGASAQVDYLVESILVPNKAVKENYHSLVVETKSGKVLNGVKIRENASELVLRNAEDVELSIPIADIEERVNGGSIMPAGLTDTLTEQELIDLVRFLSELGKVGPYAPSQARVARRWQGLDPGTPRLAEILISEPASVPTREDLAWTPVYTEVSGNLPLTDLPVVVYPIGGVRTHLLRTEVEVTTPGDLGLRINDPNGVSIWIDGRPLTPERDMSAELPRGRHTILLRVELALRNAPLRLELVDLPNSPAIARFVTGK